MTEIQIAAVGDLMVKRYIISDAKQPDGTYSFSPLFAKVAPYLKQADLTIGNLETTFAGSGTNAGKAHDQAVRYSNVQTNLPLHLRKPDSTY